MNNFTYGHRSLSDFSPTQKAGTGAVSANDNFAAIYAGPNTSGHTVYDNRPGYMPVLGFYNKQEALNYVEKANANNCN